MNVVAECTWWRMTGAYAPYRAGVSSPMMERIDGGEVRAANQLPAGALYCAPREGDPNAWPAAGPDGFAVVCVLPDHHHWYIDGRANNCTKRDDHGHRCWCRHGTIGEPVTVDKVGNTCDAGAGSIKTDGWHGFLRDGKLVL